MCQWFNREIKCPEYINYELDKNNNFNFLRLLLAYIVVIYHSMVLSGNSYSLYPLFDGDIAVKGFFIISGFLIIRSYWNSKSVKEYFIKRCKRLLPAYYLVIIICPMILSLLSTLSPSEYFSSPILFRYLVCNGLFMNFLQPSLPGVFGINPNNAINGSLWTIKLEIGFYIIVPVFVWLFNKCKTAQRINIVLLCIYILAYIYRIVCGYLFKKTGNGLLGEMGHQLPGYIQYFAMGIVYAVNYKIVRKYEKVLIIPGIILIVLHYIIGTDYLLPIGLGIVIMFIAFNIKQLNDIGKSGDYSYGAYIFHYPIVQVFVAMGIFKISKDIAILIVMGIVFSVSYMSWNLLEKKVLKRK